ncbi:MAG: hypothetical protein IJS42_03205, partial [Synergistaceae bacterium]|nr:hypothetical protein [Synergistaceae bacterium]
MKSSRILPVLILLFTSIIFLPDRVNSASKSKTKPSIDAQISAEEKKRSDLTRQIQDYKNQIKRMGKQVEGLLTKVNDLQQDEVYARQELTILELQNQKIQENIKTLDDVMKKEQVKIDA